MREAFIGKLWFESFEYHFKKRKRLSQLKFNTEDEYMGITEDIVLNGKLVYYVNEKNSFGNWIDKIYFSDDKWLVTVKFDEYNNFKIITSFKLDRYEDLKDYLVQRKRFLFVTEVTDEHDYKRVVKSIRGRAGS